MLGTMKQRGTVVGFYDAMNANAINKIIDQTEMKTICATKDFCLKLVEMKKSGGNPPEEQKGQEQYPFVPNGAAVHLRNLICYDGVDD